MTWELILEKLYSNEVLTSFSLLGLPTNKGGIGNSPEMALLALPFANNVYCEATIDSEHFLYLKKQRMAPKHIEKLHPFKKKYKNGFFLIQTLEAIELTKKWELSILFFDYSNKLFNKMIERKFLKENEKKDNFYAVPTISYEFLKKNIHVKKDIASEIYSHLYPDLKSFTNCGVLFRNEKSVQGDSIVLIHSPDELEKHIIKSKEVSGSFYRLFLSHEIKHHLGIHFIIFEGKVSVLGTTKQKSRNFRHFGSSTIELDYESKLYLNNTIKNVSDNLISLGVNSGIFCLEGFMLRSENGIKFVVHDFNPCISQGFFTLLFQFIIKYKFGIDLNICISLTSIYVKGKERIDFKWIDLNQISEGVFPLLFVDNNQSNLPFRRIVAMVASMSKNDPEEVLNKWRNSVLLINKEKIVKINDMYF